MQSARKSTEPEAPPRPRVSMAQLGKLYLIIGGALAAVAWGSYQPAVYGQDAPTMTAQWIETESKLNTAARDAALERFFLWPVSFAVWCYQGRSGFGEWLAPGLYFTMEDGL